MNDLYIFSIVTVLCLLLLLVVLFKRNMKINSKSKKENREKDSSGKLT